MMDRESRVCLFSGAPFSGAPYGRGQFQNKSGSPACGLSDLRENGKRFGILGAFCGGFGLGGIHSERTITHKKNECDWRIS
jgi:hypothetical protein